MTNFKRADRVADLLRGEISDIFLRRISDPRVKSLVITDVRVTGDLRLAKVFYVEQGKDVCSPETEAGLQHITGFLKRELAKRIKLRYLPGILFIYDESFAYGSRIDRLLLEIHKAEVGFESENY
ncbi:MAG: 30S ribosome-binding factor RbfA [Deltaproteobacteria bacterium]|nr:30S ribosome-binding factor RbfA [Deltaproteobacteria bacterium]